ncbi:MAG: DUF2868 domain-containing protein [Casimicrobiaceae bacterium]
MDENAALEVTAIQALDGAHRAQSVWTDADRAWASRAAAEVVGEGGAPESFLATRARLALARVGERYKAFPRVVNAMRWRPWVGNIIVASAFLAGLAIDEIGGQQRINLLSPPFFGLLVWNLAVYAMLVVGFIMRYGDAASPGPARGFVIRWAGGRANAGRGELAPAIAQFASQWAILSASLYGARVARILHLAAASFAVGLVAGLYLRGIAFEYRATWESTFLDAQTVRSLLAIALAPGSAISAIPIPSLAEVEAIRAPAGENAARWLHLMAGTVALVVIAPRLALALWSGSLERFRQGHLPVALDQPYFARLLRGFRGGPVRVHVIPYSYALPAAASATLERVIRGVVGANASLTVRAPVAYGGEDALATDAVFEGSAHVIAVFNSTATPERETHGAFLDAAARRLGPGGTLVALVDESAFRERWNSEPERVEGRRASWRALCADCTVACAFADLGASDAVDATIELERALEKAML